MSNSKVHNTITTLLIIVLSLAAVAMVGYVVYEVATGNARQHGRKNPVRQAEEYLHAVLQLRLAVAQFQADTGRYPLTHDLQELTVNRDPKMGKPIPHWKGPYIFPGAHPIPGTQLPANPYADPANAKITRHWLYNPADGSITSAVAGTPDDSMR